MSTSTPTTMPTGDARTLVHLSAILNQLPKSLWLPLIPQTGGTLQQRAQTLQHWRQTLLKGQLPTPQADLPWPVYEVAASVLGTLQDLNIARFCRDAPKLTDMLLAELIPLFDAARRDYLTKQQSFFDELKKAALKAEQAKARAEKRRAKKQTKQHTGDTTVPADSTKTKDAVVGTGQGKKITLSKSARAKLKADAEQQTKEWLTRWKDEKFISTWEERVDMWAEIAEVFGQLGRFWGRGWDLSQGILRHTGWAEATKLRKLLKTLPQLKALIKSLGRLRLSQELEMTALQQVIQKIRRATESPPPHAPTVPAETKGLVYDNELSRMLPSEAAMLGHPVLRKLWFARYAERSLLSYLVVGTSPIKTKEDEQAEPTSKPKPRQERGPIIVVIDTSGSMHGVPEQVAKAIALESACVAYDEKRACMLYAFSGPGQVIELDISLKNQQPSDLLAFLGSSFHGGTDVNVPVERMLKNMQQKNWRLADALIVSDGGFQVDDALAKKVRDACDEGNNRVYGLLVGGKDTRAMEKLCTQVTHFAHWDAAFSSR